MCLYEDGQGTNFAGFEGYDGGVEGFQVANPPVIYERCPIQATTNGVGCPGPLDMMPTTGDDPDPIILLSRRLVGVISSARKSHFARPLTPLERCVVFSRERNRFGADSSFTDYRQDDKGPTVVAPEGDNEEDSLV